MIPKKKTGQTVTYYTVLCPVFQSLHLYNKYAQAKHIHVKSVQNPPAFYRRSPAPA